MSLLLDILRDNLSFKVFNGIAADVLLLCYLVPLSTVLTEGEGVGGETVTAGLGLRLRQLLLNSSEGELYPYPHLASTITGF